MSGGLRQTLAVTMGTMRAMTNLDATGQARSSAGGRQASALRRLLIVAGLAVLGAAPPLAAFAQTASPYTSYLRHDVQRRLVGEIGPDPDGGGPLKHPATRYAYTVDGQLRSIERGTVNGITDGDWAAFAVMETVTFDYDASGRRIRQTSSGGITQYSFDAAGKLVCEAVRMNAAASLPTGPDAACQLTTAGADGPDRITRTVYDAASQVTQVVKAYGTPLQQVYAAYEYTPNGQKRAVTDANGNRSSYIYDGHDRLQQWFFPSPTTPGQINPADYEEYGYDANGNRTSLRKRDGQQIAYTYDALNRVTVKDYADNARAKADDVYYAYDLRGLQREARFGSSSGNGVINTYDKAGRLATSATYGRQLSYGYDGASNRTRVTHPDGFYAEYNYNALNQLKSILDSAGGILATYGYDDLGRRDYGAIGLVATVDYGYDPASRLNLLRHDLAGTASDLELTFGYNRASQVVTRTASNDTYVWTNHYNVERPYLANGLNQYTKAGPRQISYDPNGNLLNDGALAFSYDAENRWVSTTGYKSVSLSYDPLGRLAETVGSVTTRFLYDGDALVAEYDGAGNLLRRYVHGPGVDEPLVWYEGASTSDKRFLHANHQGSIIAVTDSAGNVVGTNAYGPYGIPAQTHLGRFLYTGQAFIPEVGLYHYKARAYSPTLGRFLQTDPVGYDDQMNLYAYVANDPVNKTDPTGRTGLSEVADIAKSVLTNPDTYVGALEVVAGVSMITAGTGGVGASGAAEVGSLGLATPVAAPVAAVSVSAIATGTIIATDGASRIDAALQGAILENRNKNKLGPDSNAAGDHSTFKKGPDGRITNTATYKKNANNPSGFQEVKRVDVTGKAHTNPDGTQVPTPHVKEAGTRGVRPALPDELPK